MTLPKKLPLFKYNWKAETWNLIFALGLVAGGLLAGNLLSNPMPVAIAEETSAMLKNQGITDQSGLVPATLFSLENLLSIRGLLLMGLGGFLVGFGTRWARGCTSGHGIFGLGTMQWPSLIATATFFAGGIIMSWFVLPYILGL